MKTSNRYHKELIWIDLVNPDYAAIDELAIAHKLSPRVVEDLRSPIPRSRIESTENYLYLVFHFPESETINGKTRFIDKELDFILTKDHFITVRYCDINLLYLFEKSIEHKANEDFSVGDMFYSLMHMTYRHIEKNLDRLSLSITAVEHELYHGNEEKVIPKISQIKREMLSLDKALNSHGRILSELAQQCHELLGSDFCQNITWLEREYNEIKVTHSHLREILDNLRATGDSLVSAKGFLVTRILAAITMIIFPITISLQLITNGMRNISHSPFMIAFLFLIGISLSVCVFIYFRKKTWL
jgi:Mg2+ and Co2+ transporter CorA